MEYRDFVELIQGTEYDFLRTNSHLGENIMFLTLGGSHAYGTNIEGSDVDVRGVALNSKRDLLGLRNFEQFTDERTDTTVYAFRKFVGLVSACNPNTIELLGGRKEHFTQVSPAGLMLLDNKKLFLSRRAVYSFGGYANAQLRRLENKCAREEVDEEKKVQYILGSCRHAMAQIAEKHGLPENLFNISVDTDLTFHIHAGDGWNDFQDAPFEELLGYLKELKQIQDSYEKFGRRNQKAMDKGKLNKHAMHLIRLYLMAFDILEREEINTYRENDREFLLSIRNGAFMNEDGLFIPEFFNLVNEYEKRLTYAARETSLPDKPDYKKIEELVMAVNKFVVETK